ncbi:MAG: hypothetical protein GVY16_02080 [Planctomycetes bacterium]|jgi:hypothetical protein|nr:hypothetical protein [Planctomycetota bacterium]
MHMMTLLAQEDTDAVDNFFSSLFTWWNGLLFLLLIAIIVGYFMWRRRQM